MTNKPPLINLDTIVAQRENLLVSELDAETILMNASWAAYFGLDATAQVIWNLIAQPRRVSEVCEQLIARYQVEPQVCQQQVCAFLNELHQEGLLAIQPEPEG